MEQISENQIESSNSQAEENETFSKKKQVLLTQVQEFRNTKISKLRGINHWWNIGLTVAGITLTSLTTVLGVIDNEALKVWIKIGVALSGSVAVAAQSANREFKVKGKAGEYTLIEAELKILVDKVSNIENQTDFKTLEGEYHNLLRRAAKAEAQVSEKD
ncbi:hypothetical protein VF14_03725 [Nostoc linckia z18]|uniref:Uncharacterized protein n=3 Tax=Nostoc linckia TaxID=92942 RepID=A0A9Q6EII4_NOSLI|nr:hypothetical protein VF02_01975 [Nostoc linckia z1]PHJ70655.1 hypothetical protein VF05_09385 [Nostoc linckia z3]PHJ76089.1 hypothetical protein VF03_08235 [Nostoc linckia z2]PHJ83935.1 hypothetical protein VF06_11455 [Nostoc linckia z4]PHJ91445.1 hypothetical protein VF07_04880 [Nostoc linckia z6]PHJ96772.1 hypothetical protein VF08_29785 [Nostoc linckia z8]PHK00338.1 hypothetical protein VF04_03745 [Nostoc linckia z7]PHK12129.1 hypothetical protein VF10_34345 [Nostoc linckia z13]PHK128